jgi:pimeloyl-ACP methyl ester carboxylesterase
MLMFLVLLPAAVVLVVSGMALGFAITLTQPPRKPLSQTPGDMELPFEVVRFSSHDGVTLVGWLIGPELLGPPVVILHGYTDNKSSYLPHARFLYEHGYPSFVYDQRGHGESETARISLGPLEARDVHAALGTLSGKGRGDKFPVWGISMGAATALLAASESQSIGGIISESSYERLDAVVADTVRLRHYVPRFPLVPMALVLASFRARVNLREVSIPNAVEALGDRPLLVVSGESDPRMPPEVGGRLLSHARNGQGHVVVPGADHAECWPLGQPAYGEEVLRFLEKL